MQNTSRITRTKSGSMFIPKSHKSSHRSTVDSVCPTPAVNKHADPNRRRVIAVDSEFELTPTPTTTSKKRKSPERKKSISSSSEGSVPSLRKRMRMSTPDSEKSSDSEGSVRTPKTKKRKTVSSDESSGSKSRVRVEGPSKLMKAARKNYNKVAIRRKIDVVPQLIDPLARVRSPTPPTASKMTPTVSDVVVNVEELSPTKSLPLRPLNHPRTKTALFIPKVQKPINVNGPMSLAEYARRCSEAGPALC